MIAQPHGGLRSYVFPIVASPAKRHPDSLAQTSMADLIPRGLVGQAGAQRFISALGDSGEKTRQTPKAKHTRANHDDNHRKFTFRVFDKPDGNMHVKLKQAAFIDQLSFLFRGVKQSIVPDFWFVRSPSRSQCRLNKKSRKCLNDADGIRALRS